MQFLLLLLLFFWRVAMPVLFLHIKYYISKTVSPSRSFIELWSCFYMRLGGIPERMNTVLWQCVGCTSGQVSFLFFFSDVTPLNRQDDLIWLCWNGVFGINISDWPVLQGKRFYSQVFPSASPKHTYLFPFSLFVRDEIHKANGDDPSIKSRLSAASPNITARVMVVVKECRLIHLDKLRCELDFLQQLNKLT